MNVRTCLFKLLGEENDLEHVKHHGMRSEGSLLVVSKVVTGIFPSIVRTSCVNGMQ